MKLVTPEEAALLRLLFGRYRFMLEYSPHALEFMPVKCNTADLIKLCTEVVDNAESYPFDKLCRWLGFVQGLMASKSLINVDRERDYTRPLFHELYGEEVKSFGD